MRSLQWSETNRRSLGRWGPPDVTGYRKAKAVAAAAWDLDRTPAGIRPVVRGPTAAAWSSPRLQAHRRAAVYRRRRLGVATLAVTVVAVATLLLGVWPMRSAAATADGGVARVEIVIAPGDTVWDLAYAHAPAGQSPQAYIASILDVNDVDATALLPGTVLRLP